MPPVHAECGAGFGLRSVERAGGTEALLFAAKRKSCNRFAMQYIFISVCEACGSGVGACVANGGVVAKRNAAHSFMERR